MKLSDVKKPNVYSVAEVATFMKVSRFTVFRLIKAGKLEAINVGRSIKPVWSITAEAVQKYYDTLTSKSKK